VLSGVFSLKKRDSRQNWSDTSLGAHTVWAGPRRSSNVGRLPRGRYRIMRARC
jgi:hypothetical protein